MFKFGDGMDRENKGDMGFMTRVRDLISALCSAKSSRTLKSNLNPAAGSTVYSLGTPELGEG